MTFETFLRSVIAFNTDVRLVPLRNGVAVRFYAHPQGVNGPTVDFEVRGNRLVPLGFPATEPKDSPL
jgi:hypothetical protein